MGLEIGRVIGVGVVGVMDGRGSHEWSLMGVRTSLSGLRCARFMPDPPPARSAPANVRLPRGLLVSIEAVAVLRSADEFTPAVSVTTGVKGGATRPRSA